MGLFKLLFYFILFYLVFSFIRLVWRVNKARKHFEDTYHRNQESIHKKEGETSIRYVPDQETKEENKAKKDGEYIEYEDLKQ